MKIVYWRLPKLLQTWMCMQSPKIRNPGLFYIKATIKDNSNQLISATVGKEEMSSKQNNETSKTSPENCMMLAEASEATTMIFADPQRKLKNRVERKSI